MNFNPLYTHSNLFTGAAAASFLFSYAHGRRHKRQLGRDSGFNPVSTALSLVDDIPVVIGTLTKKGKLDYPSLGLSLLEGYAISDLSSKFGKSFGEASTFSDYASALGGAATYYAGQVAITSFYEHRVNSGVFSQKNLESMMNHAPTAERLERSLIHHLGEVDKGSSISTLIGLAKDRGVLGKAVGAVKAQSLGPVAALSLVAVPVVAGIVRSLTKWVDRKRHETSSDVYSASSLMSNGFNVHHQILEGDLGMRIKQMTDAPFYPESGTNPLMSIFSGARQLAVNSLKSAPSIISSPIVEIGELIGSKPVPIETVVPKVVNRYATPKIKVKLSSSGSKYIATKKALMNKIESGRIGKRSNFARSYSGN